VRLLLLGTGLRDDLARAGRRFAGPRAAPRTAPARRALQLLLLELELLFLFELLELPLPAVVLLAQQPIALRVLFTLGVLVALQLALEVLLAELLVHARVPGADRTRVDGVGPKRHGLRITGAPRGDVAAERPESPNAKPTGAEAEAVRIVAAADPATADGAKGIVQVVVAARRCSRLRVVVLRRAVTMVGRRRGAAALVVVVRVRTDHAPAAVLAQRALPRLMPPQGAPAALVAVPSLGSNQIIEGLDIVNLDPVGSHPLKGLLALALREKKKY
jgi:hypothetical protein